MYGGGGKGGGGEPSRRVTRQRKVSTRMAVVDEGTRNQAAQARLEAFEADNAEPQDALFGLEGSDDDFVLGEGSDDSGGELGGGRKGRGKKRKGAGTSVRKTRGMLADRRGGPKSFAKLLEESGLLEAPQDEVNYLTAAVGPPATSARRKFCTVCGFQSTYTCLRCGSQYCSRRCYGVHTETRCLKFMA